MVRASLPCRAGSQTSTPLAAPMARAVRRPRDLTVGGHGDEAHLATTGGVDELQRHLDAVAVGLVEDELAVALQGVGAGIERTRRGRVRDLLHTHDHVHARDIVTDGYRGHPTRRTW